MTETSKTPRTDREVYTVSAADIGFVVVNPALCRELEESLSEAVSRAELAEGMADDACASAIQCHGFLGDDGYHDTTGEPVGPDIDYLVGRGLAERHPERPDLVRFIEPKEASK